MPAYISYFQFLHKLEYENLFKICVFGDLDAIVSKPDQNKTFNITFKSVISNFFLTMSSCLHQFKLEVSVILKIN